MFKIEKINPKDYGKFAFIGIIVGMFVGNIKVTHPAILLFKLLGIFIFFMGIFYLVKAVIYEIKIRKNNHVEKEKRQFYDHDQGVILKNIFIILILFLGIMAFLDEFYSIRDNVNHWFMGLAITVSIVFIWNNVIKKISKK